MHCPDHCIAVSPHSAHRYTTCPAFDAIARTPTVPLVVVTEVRRWGRSSVDAGDGRANECECEACAPERERLLAVDPLADRNFKLPPTPSRPFRDAPDIFDATDVTYEAGIFDPQPRAVNTRASCLRRRHMNGGLKLKCKASRILEVRPHPLLGPPLPVQVTVPHLLPALIGQPRPALEPLRRHLARGRLPTPGVLVRHVHHVLPVELARSGLRAEDPTGEGRDNHGKLRASERGERVSADERAADEQTRMQWARQLTSRDVLSAPPMRQLTSTYVCPEEVDFEELFRRMRDAGRTHKRTSEKFTAHVAVSVLVFFLRCSVPVYERQRCVSQGDATQCTSSSN